MVCIPNCDKIVPGMLMAAMRLDIPTIFVSGGPMPAGRTADGRTVDLISVFEGVGAFKAGTIDEAELKELEDNGCPACGSCSGLFTANSMNCISEALGLALPFNGTALANSDQRTALAERAGREILRLIEGDLTARRIARAGGLRRRLRPRHGHGRQLQHRAPPPCHRPRGGIDYDLHRLNEIADRVPQLCKISPASKLHMEDLHRAGGIPALLAELQRATGFSTRTGRRRADPRSARSSPAREPTDREVILSFDDPHSKTGGLAVLFGNLAPEGAVVKTGAVDPAMRRHSGPARIYESQDDALRGIYAGEVSAGDVVVIRYEGPAGGPGMQEMLSPTSAIMGMGLGESVALITDGRFSGGTRGAPASVTSAPRRPRGAPSRPSNPATSSPSMSMRGPSMSSSATRRSRRGSRPCRRSRSRPTSRWLKRYSKMVTSASTGAVLSGGLTVVSPQRRKAQRSQSIATSHMQDIAPDEGGGVGDGRTATTF